MSGLEYLNSHTFFTGVLSHTSINYVKEQLQLKTRPEVGKHAKTSHPRQQTPPTGNVLC
jgi:hypothetical protein